MSASAKSLVATFRAVLADLSGSLREKVRRTPPGSQLVTSITDEVRVLQDDGKATDEDMCDVASRGWRDRAFRAEELSASGNSDGEVLPAHDADTTNSHTARERRSTIEVHSNFSEASHLRSSITHPKTHLSEGRFASR